MDFIQINKFSKLHDGHKIIFCKTDFIYEEFKYIETLNHNVVLITGNSDYPITEEMFKLRPKNIIKWFAQNALVNHNILEPLPLGLENKLVSLRENHGIGYFDRVLTKETLLLRDLNIIPDKMIYSNFNLLTNYEYRNFIKNSISDLSYVDCEESNLDLESYFNTILEYEAIICPMGNGVDTHRLWEVLYSNRIPITFKVDNYKLYELYKKLPIIILNDVNELRNYELITQKIKEMKTKKYDKELLSVEYWVKQILTI